MRSRKVVVVAGTFDRLHIGHMALIAEAFKAGDEVVVGLMADEHVGRKVAGPPDPYERRLEELTDYIEKAKESLGCKPYRVVKISGPYDVVLDIEDLYALVVSEETLPRGIEVNRLRTAKGWRPLKLIVVPVIHSADGRPISSHRVRLGEIDKYGELRTRVLDVY